MAGTARKRGAGGTVLKAEAGLNLFTNYLLTIILLMSTGEMGEHLSSPGPDAGLWRLSN